MYPLEETSTTTIPLNWQEPEVTNGSPKSQYTIPQFPDDALGRMQDAADLALMCVKPVKGIDDAAYMKVCRCIKESFCWPCIN